MKNQWLEFFYGSVTVRVEGKGIERFLNVLIRNGLHVWNVKRHGSGTATFTMRLRDALQIRRYARHSGCSIGFLRRNGAPFLVKRIFKNSGFFLGAVAFFLIIIVLSNSIWGIEIKGAKPATEYKIRKELDHMGIKVGKFQFTVDSVESIQRKLTNNIGAITWVGVELKGTTYHFQVVEKKQPKDPKLLAPQNLIAKKKAIIVKRFVERGKPVVDLNDHVEAGQLLVSGLIGKEDGPTQAVAAKGEILGETWYKSYVELPLQTRFKVYNGKEQQKHSLLIGKFEVPIWGFQKVKFREYETEKNDHAIHFFKWSLPISYINRTFREKEDIIRTYSKEEAIKEAMEIAKKDIKKRLDEDATIKDTKILHEAFQNGKVTLSIHFKIYENIAKGQPITQGDLMND